MTDEKKIRMYARIVGIFAIIAGIYVYDGNMRMDFEPFITSASIICIVVGISFFIMSFFVKIKTPTKTETSKPLNTEASYFDGGLFSFLGWQILGGLITIFSLGICYPWAICMSYGWKINHTIINGKRLRFTGKAGDLFLHWLKWLFLTIITLGIYSFWLFISIEKWKVKHTIMTDLENTISTPTNINTTSVSIDTSNSLFGSSSGETWVCKKCDETNPNSSSFCKGCGEYKPTNTSIPSSIKNTTPKPKPIYIDTPKPVSIEIENPDTYDAVAGIWTCGKCSKQNSAMYDKCQECGKPYGEPV